MERLKTISKHFYDDEIMFKDEKTGDIHLKPGVKRMNFGDSIDPDKLESHINYHEITYRKQLELIETLGRDWDND